MVLIVVDLQPMFIRERTNHVVEAIRNITKKFKFNFLIQTLWYNNDTSNFVKRLNYTKGLEAQGSVLDVKTDAYIKRVGYSTVTDDMKSLLRSDDVIFVCGLETDACIMATCMDLFSAGYNFYVVSDAIGSNDYEAHNTGLYLMQRNLGHKTFIASEDIKKKYWESYYEHNK